MRNIPGILHWRRTVAAQPAASQHSSSRVAPSMSASEALGNAGRQLLASAPHVTKNFEWIAVVGGFLAFFAAFGIGA